MNHKEGIVLFLLLVLSGAFFFWYLFGSIGVEVVPNPWILSISSGLFVLLLILFLFWLANLMLDNIGGRRYVY